jgi:hypothetical protein
MARSSFVHPPLAVGALRIPDRSDAPNDAPNDAAIAVASAVTVTTKRMRVLRLMVVA